MKSIYVKKRMLRMVCTVLICFAFGDVSAQDNFKNEILWDTWGVPHIYGQSEEDLFFAFGWAQMHSHGDLLLRLYGQARGRGAEYWGQRYVSLDRFVHTMGTHVRSQAWYEAQTPAFRAHVDAFAKGINAYAEAHNDLLADSVRVVLPVSGIDVMAHAQRVLNLTFVASRVRQQTRRWESLGSNAWAVSPVRSESGHALLLVNPHLPWEHQFMFYEAQLVAPGIDVYGATLVGMPHIVVGFNSHLGWTHTVNTFDGVDLFELTRVDQGYEWDGGLKSFDMTTSVIKIKQDDGTFVEKEFRVEHSIHGPVLGQREGKALAMRMVGLDTPGAMAQWWAMAKAKNLREFEGALKQLQIPMFNVVYADQDGHIMYLFNGQVPVRSKGDVNFWRNPVPGNTSALLWTQTHPYEDLPKVVDPPNGWIQNCNDPPWTSTIPMVLNPKDFPAYMSPQGVRFRQQHSIGLLQADDQMSLDEMVRYKHSTRVLLADRILDDLRDAVDQFGGKVAQEAMAVLSAWDRQTNAQSRGGVLFEAWFQIQRPRFAISWKKEKPLTTPDGLADPKAVVKTLEKAAGLVKEMYGTLDVPWGDVYRIRYAGLDLPANGGRHPLGVFRVLDFDRDHDGKYKAISGDSFVAAIEFSNPVRAKALLSYGNATQSHSSHVGDQLKLFVQQELRDVWRTRAAVQKNLSRTDTF